MSSVDNRIVNMHFNSDDFQAGAESSVAALEGLESTISGMGGDGSIQEMGQSIDDVSVRFGALQVAGVAALATIASSATTAAINIGQNLLGAVTSLLGASGFQRAIDLEQAAFQFRGLGLNVKEVMDNATAAVDGTSFALNEAAGVASQFAGGGVKAGQDMENALRGVAGVAAQTGRSYSEIGQIFAGVAATGRLSSMDLFQFQTRNLDVTGALAEELGKTQDQIRLMVSAGEIDFKTFATAMDNAFGSNAAKANRTFTGALANMKTAVTRIGADFFSGILDPAGDVFNALSSSIKVIQKGLAPLSESFGNVAQSAADGVVAFLESSRVMRILGLVVEGVQNIFAPFGALLKAIGDAWLEVFPSKAHQGHRVVFTLAKAFELLTTPLAWLAEQIPRITPLLVALFEAFRVGWVAVSGLSEILGELVQKAAGIGSSIIEGLMGGLTGEEIQNAIVKLANDIIEWIKGALGIASPAAELVPVGTAIIEGIVMGMVAATNFIFEALGKIGSAIIDGFQRMFGDMDALDWTAFFNAILTGGVLLAIRSMVKTISGFVDSLAAVTSPFGQLTETLKTMQNSVRAQMILGIAIAVGILTASLVALSLLDPKKAAVGLGFLAAEMALLVGAMAVLGKLNPQAIVAVAGSMILVSSAMVILSGAIAVLGNLDMLTLAKGLGALAVALAIMVVALGALTLLSVGPGMVAAGAGILLIATAMTIMAGAIAILGNLEFKTLANGLTAMAIGLAIFTTALVGLTLVGPTVIVSAAAILIVAEAMVILAGAIAIIGNLDFDTLIKGLTAMAIGLGLFVVALTALTLLGPTVIIAAGAILVMSAAMVIMAKAIGALGEMSVGDIAKALTAIAIGFGILIVAASAAIAVAPGLIALGASVALLGLGLALAGAGLLAAATAFAIFAAVGTAGIAVLVAGFTALIALLPSLAVQLAASFVAFVEALAAAAPDLRKAFGEIIKSALGTFRDAIPEFKKTANVFLQALFDVVIRNIPLWGRAFSALIKEGLRVLREGIPLYVRTGIAIIVGVIQGIADGIPRIARAATNLVIAFIKGMQESANRIINAGADAVIDFLHGIADTIRTKGQEIRDAGLDIADAIIDGVVQGLQDGAHFVVDAALDMAQGAMKAAAGPLGFFLGSPSKVAIYWGEMIVAGLVKGIKDNISNAVGAAIALANATIAAGDKAIASAQKDATKRQIAAERAAAKSRIADKLAKAAEKASRQSPKDKDLERRAKLARKHADALSKAAAEAQKKADAAVQRVSNVQEFRDADDQGKGDILVERAKNLSDRALKLLAQANAEAQAAKDLQGKARKQMLKAAREDAQAAKRLADKSKASQKRAADFYAQSVNDRIKAIEDARKAEEERLRLEQEFEAATDAGKAEILQQRAEAAQARSEKAQAQADALIKQAKKLAKTDAARAQRLLDRAEALVEEANQAAADAKSDAEQAAQLLDQANNPNSAGANTSLQLSRSAMEDAASAIDRYTKSLEQAEEAAMAATPVYQFVQNNNSPESLTDLEIYRQTKNLLSASEIKMGAPV